MLQFPVEFNLEQQQREEMGNKTIEMLQTDWLKLKGSLSENCSVLAKQPPSYSGDIFFPIFFSGWNVYTIEFISYVSNWLAYCRADNVN